MHSPSSGLRVRLVSAGCWKIGGVLELRNTRRERRDERRFAGMISGLRRERCRSHALLPEEADCFRPCHWRLINVQSPPGSRRRASRCARDVGEVPVAPAAPALFGVETTTVPRHPHYYSGPGGDDGRERERRDQHHKKGKTSNLFLLVRITGNSPVAAARKFYPSISQDLFGPHRTLGFSNALRVYVFAVPRYGAFQLPPQYQYNTTLIASRFDGKRNLLSQDLAYRQRRESCVAHARKLLRDQICRVRRAHTNSRPVEFFSIRPKRRSWGVVNCYGLQKMGLAFNNAAWSTIFRLAGDFMYLKSYSLRAPNAHFTPFQITRAFKERVSL
ncbi:hypothetical protein C8J57DRAFT_1243473 [Mycena rebaudengoi]|nr:hypothetical protein C8J57DRAFT_1243473 [Mycena rebaudengoi]